MKKKFRNAPLPNEAQFIKSLGPSSPENWAGREPMRKKGRLQVWKERKKQKKKERKKRYRMIKRIQVRFRKKGRKKDKRN